MLVAAAVAAAIAYGIWRGADAALGDGLPALIVGVGLAVGVSALTYLAGTRALGFPEADRIIALLRRREAAA
jgi:hypothetical protein